MKMYRDFSDNNSGVYLNRIENRCGQGERGGLDEGITAVKRKWVKKIRMGLMTRLVAVSTMIYVQYKPFAFRTCSAEPFLLPPKSCVPYLIAPESERWTSCL